MIRVLCRADGACTPQDGYYVVEFDLEENAGRGRIGVTGDPGEAKLFESKVDALRYWKRQSVVYPFRLWDGKPNRPFTFWTIEILPQS